MEVDRTKFVSSSEESEPEKRTGSLSTLLDSPALLRDALLEEQSRALSESDSVRLLRCEIALRRLADARTRPKLTELKRMVENHIGTMDRAWVVERASDSRLVAVPDYLALFIESMRFCDDFQREESERSAVAFERKAEARKLSSISETKREGKVSWVFHFFELCDDCQSEDCDDDGEAVFAKTARLPNRAFEGLWESLHFDDASVKSDLLAYASTAMDFARAALSPTLISAHRCILSAGPPGVGKTTLCKAFAQKLSVRLAHRFARAGMAAIEVNAHALFSKWFSESGKLVAALFDSIAARLDSGALAIVVVDEIESLAMARSRQRDGGGGSGEPADGIRAVNALLTGLDRVRHHENCLVLATTNLLEFVDAAFVDRCDLVVNVPLPSERARRAIVESCVREMEDKGVVRDDDGGGDDGVAGFATAIARLSEGLSGRALRRLPLLASAWFITAAGIPVSVKEPVGRRLLCLAMIAAVQKQRAEREKRA